MFQQGFPRLQITAQTCVPKVCDAPIKAGGKEWMKVPYGEGLASSTGPKLCAVVCKGGSEALAGYVQAGY